MGKKLRRKSTIHLVSQLVPSPSTHKSTKNQPDPDLHLKQKVPGLEPLLYFLRNVVWLKHHAQEHTHEHTGQTLAQCAREAILDVQAFLHAMFTAQKNVCWVYDSQKSDEDFQSSVLRCTINGFGHVEEDLTRGTKRLEKKLKLAVEFNNLPVLEHVIESTGLRQLNTEIATNVMNKALQNALTMLRRHPIVHYLVHNGASVEGYDPHSAIPETRKAGRQNWAALLDLIPHATVPRGVIFHKHGHVWNSDFVHPMTRRPMKVFCHRCQECVDELAHADGNRESSAQLVRALSEGSIVASPPRLRAFSTRNFRGYNEQPNKNLSPSSQESVDGGRFAWLGGGPRCCMGRRRNAEEHCTDFIRRYERWVRRTIGSSFQYKMAIVRPEFDLMIYSVLMNDRQTAFMWWKRYCYPNRAALTICRLYRRLIDKSHMPPSEKKIMRESAEFFERLALAVHTQSRIESHFLSSANVECPMRIWCGLTILDVAVLGGCEEFVEECCREEIERRFYGDLLPYQHFDIGMGIASGCGLKVAVCLHLCFLGLLAPFFMQFNKAPLSETLRFPTQNIPQDDKMRALKEFARPMQIYGEEDNFIRRREVEGQGCDYYDAKDWTTSLQTWFRALCMFWQAPVTLFIADACTLLFVCLSFTIFLVSVSDSTTREPFTGSRATQPDKGFVFPYEIALACYFASRLLSEFVQVYVTSKREYIGDMWNLLDITTVIFFTSGFVIRRICPSEEEYCEQQAWFTSGIVLNRLWEHHYSVCLFLLWTRLLRVFSCSKNLGPLVILIRHMGRDILKFAIIYCVLLVGFSTLQRGSTPGEYQEACGDAEATVVPFPVKCWRYWWIIRTFIQATAGELFLDEVTTYGSVGGMMILFVVLNLLMLNLVIAVMSNTYTKVQAAAERQYLIDLYQITNEYSRRSVVAPVPANVFFVIHEILVFFWYRERLNLCKLWKGQPARRLFDLHLRRNLPIDELILRQLYNREMAEPQQSTLAKSRHKARVQLEQGRKQLTSQKLQMDLELAQCWQNKLNSFVERARNALMEKEEFSTLLEENGLADMEKEAKTAKTDPPDSAPDATRASIDTVSLSAAPKTAPDPSTFHKTVEILQAQLEAAQQEREQEKRILETQLKAAQMLEAQLKAVQQEREQEKQTPRTALETVMASNMDEFEQSLKALPRAARDKLRVMLARSPEDDRTAQKNKNWI